MHESNCRGASGLLNRGLHAIDATPARWRGDASTIWHQQRAFKNESTRLMIVNA